MSFLTFRLFFFSASPSNNLSTMTTAAGYPPSLSQKEEPLFAALRLGPVARTGTFGSLAPSLNLDTSSNTQLSTSASKYPRIVVKDHLGRTLDTFTTLQDAIYRANWARKKLGGKLFLSHLKLLSFHYIHHHHHRHCHLHKHHHRHRRLHHGPLKG